MFPRRPLSCPRARVPPNARRLCVSLRPPPSLPCLSPVSPPSLPPSPPPPSPPLQCSDLPRCVFMSVSVREIHENSTNPRAQRVQSGHQARPDTRPCKMAHFYFFFLTLESSMLKAHPEKGVPVARAAKTLARKIQGEHTQNYQKSAWPPGGTSGSQQLPNNGGAQCSGPGAGTIYCSTSQVKPPSSRQQNATITRQFVLKLI